MRKLFMHMEEQKVWLSSEENDRDEQKMSLKTKTSSQSVIVSFSLMTIFTGQWLSPVLEKAPPIGGTVY